MQELLRGQQHSSGPAAVSGPAPAGQSAAAVAPPAPHPIAAVVDRRRDSYPDPPFLLVPLMRQSHRTDAPAAAGVAEGPSYAGSGCLELVQRGLEGEVDLAT